MLIKTAAFVEWSDGLKTAIRWSCGWKMLILSFEDENCKDCGESLFQRYVGFVSIWFKSTELANGRCNFKGEE